jgi:hypothetical protein
MDGQTYRQVQTWRSTSVRLQAAAAPAVASMAGWAREVLSWEAFNEERVSKGRKPGVGKGGKKRKGRPGKVRLSKIGTKCPVLPACLPHGLPPTAPSAASGAAPWILPQCRPATSLKPIGYTWSCLACGIGHLVPILQPLIRSSCMSCNASVMPSIHRSNASIPLPARQSVRPPFALPVQVCPWFYLSAREPPWAETICQQVWGADVRRRLLFRLQWSVALQLAAHSRSPSTGSSACSCLLLGKYLCTLAVHPQARVVDLRQPLLELEFCRAADETPLADAAPHVLPALQGGRGGIFRCVHVRV